MFLIEFGKSSLEGLLNYELEIMNYELGIVESGLERAVKNIQSKKAD